MSTNLGSNHFTYHVRQVKTSGSRLHTHRAFYDEWDSTFLRSLGLIYLLNNLPIIICASGA